MHEKHVTEDLVRKLETVARAEGGRRVARIRVRLGALSHFTPGHFREHFEEAARGTLAEGAEIEAEQSVDPTAPDAQGVVLESVDLELAETPREGFSLRENRSGSRGGHRWRRHRRPGHSAS